MPEYYRYRDESGPAVQAQDRSEPAVQGEDESGPAVTVQDVSEGYPQLGTMPQPAPTETVP